MGAAISFIVLSHPAVKFLAVPHWLLVVLRRCHILQHSRDNHRAAASSNGFVTKRESNQRHIWGAGCFNSNPMIL